MFVVYSKMALMFTVLQGFGQADHEKTKEVLSREYPERLITCSNAGY